MICGFETRMARGFFHATMLWICIPTLNAFGDDINRIYNNVLGRDADPGAYEYWNQHPTTLKEIIRNVTHSQEFKCKYIETVSDTCPQAPTQRALQDALVLVYPHVLGRKFNDEAWGTASDWVQNKGWDFLLNQLVDSDEFNQMIAQRWGLSNLGTVVPHARRPPPSPPPPPSSHGALITFQSCGYRAAGLQVACSNTSTGKRDAQTVGSNDTSNAACVNLLYRACTAVGYSCRGEGDSLRIFGSDISVTVVGPVITKKDF
jgi:hypothetical protein